MTNALFRKAQLVNLEYVLDLKLESLDRFLMLTSLLLLVAVPHLLSNVSNLVIELNQNQIHGSFVSHLENFVYFGGFVNLSFIGLEEPPVE